ncbi:MAG TPA: CDP-alcohol phosphatidyltransferase family protein [Planctomycetota bacterium]|nr:CDP-alcohol phosphatidyltransferase family protein [Planctomycetota bacterium]
MISISSLVVSAGAAFCWWKSAQVPVLLLAAPVLCYLRLWFNMLDGMVALAADQAGPTGEIFNDLPDRISDLLIFIGVAHSGLCTPLIAYWAAILALLTAYVGTLGQAVGARREYGGIMSKPWRMVALHAGAWGAFAAGPGIPILDWTCGAVILGCVETVVVRLHRIFHTLKEREGPRERTHDDRAHVPDLGPRAPVLPGVAARTRRS